MSVNVLQEGVKGKLHSLFSLFLWEGSANKRKLHLMDWGTITAPVDQHGLGILNTWDMNKTLAAKWIYSFANNKNEVWRKVVCTKSKGDQNSLMSVFGNRNNRSAFFSFVVSALWTNDRVRGAIN